MSRLPSFAFKVCSWAGPRASLWKTRACSVASVRRLSSAAASTSTPQQQHAAAEDFTITSPLYYANAGTRMLLNYWIVLCSKALDSKRIDARVTSS